MNWQWARAGYGCSLGSSLFCPLTPGKCPSDLALSAGLIEKKPSGTTRTALLPGRGIARACVKRSVPTRPLPQGHRAPTPPIQTSAQARGVRAPVTSLRAGLRRGRRRALTASPWSRGRVRGGPGHHLRNARGTRRGHMRVGQGTLRAT